MSLVPETDGTAALDANAPPAPPRARASLRDAIAKLQVVPAPTEPTAAPVPTPTPAPVPPASDPMFAMGWQQFFSQRGVAWYCAWCEDQIRTKKGIEPGIFDQDEADLLSRSLAEGLRQEFPDFTPPWWAVAMSCAAGIYFTMLKTGKPGELQKPAINDNDNKTPVIGQAPPPAPPKPSNDAVAPPLPPGVPNTWSRFARRHPPAVKQQTP